MEKIILSLLALSVVIAPRLLFAQSPDTLALRANGLSAGFHIAQLQGDFGLGLNLRTPYLFREAIALRVAGAVHWRQRPEATGDATDWGSYGTLRLGLLGGSEIVQELIRLYGEGGLLGVLPSAGIGSRVCWGGYGLLGIELFGSPRFCYFLELGGASPDARADHLPGRPTYATGFLLGGGVRLHW